MYKSFFGLNTNPFSLTPDTDCFFVGGQRQAILDALVYAVSRGDGLVKVIGEVGSGKTILARRLIETLPAQVDVFYLFNPNIPADRILYAIAIEMGLDCNNHQKEWVLHRVYQQLMELFQAGKRAVLIIDEAQAMPPETLEEIRMLSNLETSREKLLQIVLLGQPELDEKLQQHGVRQIKQRIVHEFYLPRLTLKEVMHYLVFRMQKAGLKGDLPFSFLACCLLAWGSGGLCRRLNLLAEKCLFAAFVRQTRKIGVGIVFKVVMGENKRVKTLRWLIVPAGLLLLVSTLRPVSSDSAASGRLLEPATGQTVLAQRPVEKTQFVELSDKTPALNTNAQGEYVICLLSVGQDDVAIQTKHLTTLLPESAWQRLYYRKTGRWYQFYIGLFEQPGQARHLLQTLPKTLKANRPYVIKLSETERERLQRVEAHNL